MLYQSEPILFSNSTFHTRSAFILPPRSRILNEDPKSKKFEQKESALNSPKITLKTQYTSAPTGTGLERKV